MGGPVPDHLGQDFRQASRDLRSLLSNIRLQIQSTSLEQQELLSDLQNTRQAWQTVPPAVLDPQTSSGGSRPTDPAYLKSMDPVQLEANSSTFLRATLQLGRDLLEMQAVPAEFGAVAPEAGRPNKVVATLVVPPAGVQTEQDISALQAIIPKEKPFILYLERGTTTFVQKAVFAQTVGAAALVIGNNVSEPWPYIMKNTKHQAKIELDIPVVMVKMADAQVIVTRSQQQQEQHCLPCTLQVTAHVQDCAVCADTFAVGQTVVCIPACGHVFHHSCAMQWLVGHNTCPYCRRELPTEDAAYEAERRRTERTHAGS
jgi:hypothetical protein